MGPSALFETLLHGRVAEGLGGRWYGVYPALVSDIQDPDGTGRVKVTLPWSPDTAGQRYEAWARLATLMGGNQRGSWFVPDVNDEVLVVFEGGDARRPYVIGGLWNGSDAPPESMDGSGHNYKKVLKSRNGVKVTLDDTDGQETFIAETPGGQKVTLKDGPGSVEIADSNGNSVKLETSGVTITASATLTINASAVTINASSLTHSGTATISGALTVAASVTTPSVVAGSYTPGAGNIW
ncbi:MAG TPA: phage baseplate assembly protein V [Vicinamibacterales bacterium]|nr:phage baseplate assembly protein V [Vicinamibacterales bacterium]